jgi:SAM-dependent methyltransferase
VPAPTDTTDRINGRLLEVLGLRHEGGGLRPFGARKAKQVQAILPELLAPFADGSDPRTFLDCGCGKSYLSFFLQSRLQEIGRQDAGIVGVDSDPRLIAVCEEARERLGWDAPHFICSPIRDAPAEPGVDVVCSLHACDTATDEAIARGVQLTARRIVVAPCCHRDLQRALKRRQVGPPLGKVLRTFPLLSDRFSSLATEAVRATALRASGYSARIFEFCPGLVTPKNLLLVAERARRPSRQARELLTDLLAFLGHRPAICRMLDLP